MARAFSGTRYPAGSNANPSAAPNAGTPGGRAGGRPGRMQVMLGDEMYLWVLVLLELIATGMLRQKFRRYHGG